jgi:predicted O-methyltransferase YrrM
MSERPPDPAPIMALTVAYWGAQALLTANRIGLFDACAGAPLPLEAIAARLGTAPRPTELLLKSLVGLGLLESRDGGYRNTRLADFYLVSNSPAFMGNALRYSDNLYATWGELERALREDRPPLAAETYLGDDRKTTRDFVHGMHQRAMAAGRALVELVDLGGRTRMLDVGGGPGTYASLFARKYAQLDVQLLELPGVAEIAKEIVADMGCADRVSVLAGSYDDTPFPGGNDVVLISGVLHRESAGGCRALIAKAAACLVPGGLLVVSDVFTDEGGATPVFAALFGVNMMLTAPSGGVHSDADVGRWLAEAGVGEITVRPFPPPMPHRVVIGTKPRN